MNRCSKKSKKHRKKGPRKLSPKKIAELRSIISPNNICQVTKQVTHNPVLDHDHKTNYVRGVIDRQVNAWEGKVSNSFVRLGLHKRFDLVDLLRSLADYLEHNIQHEIKINYKE